MKLLDMPGYFYPEEMSSTHIDDDRYRAIADAGIETVLYAAMPTRGINDDVRSYYKKKRVETMYGGMMTVHRYPLYREGNNPVFRALRYTIQCIQQFNIGVFAREAKGCDVIFSGSTPPIKGAVMALIKKCRKNLKFIYNIHDIFPDSLSGSGLVKKGGFFWKVGRVIENFTYHNADKIIVISEDFKQNLIAKGVPPEKIEVVYNWVDENAVHPVSKNDNMLYEEFGLSRNKFTVVYAGNLGNAQNIGIILDGASRLPEVQFALFGTGGLETVIRGRIAKENLKNVYLNPLQHYKLVSYVYSLGDVGIVSCKAGLGGSAMPSKTWTIMSCGRPVLASFDEGELKEILEKNQCGVFTHSGDVEEFVSAIKLFESSSLLCEKMGQNARQFILDNLTKEIGTRRYVEIIKSVVK